MFGEFHLNGEIRISMNSTFITLVPKKDWSTKVTHSLTNRLVFGVQQIISRVLRRLSEVLMTTFTSIRVLLFKW